MPNIPSIRFFRAGLILVPLLLFMVGCKSGSTSPAPPATTLQKLAKYETDITTGVAAALQIVKDLQTGGLISTATATQIATDLQKVTTVNGQLITITQSITALTPAQQTQIQNLVNPLITALQADIQNGVLGIKNPASQAAANAALSALVVTLQLIFSGVVGG